MKLGIIAALVIAIAARTAAAQPDVVFSPSSYTTLPPDPIVYLFAPASDIGPPVVDVSSEGDGDAALVTAEPVAASGAWRVYRVRVPTGPWASVDLRYGGEHASYRIARAALAHRVEALLGYSSIAGACRPTDRSIVIGVRGDAVAYRVEWEARSWRELVGGEPRRAYLPIERDDSRFEHVSIGRVDCGGWNVPEHAFDQPRATRLVALFADGREQAIAIGVQQLVDDPRDHDVPISVAPGTIAPPPPRSPDEPAWWPFALFPLVTVVACGVVARRAAMAAVAAVLATIALARPAAAECGTPPVRISPAPGAVLAVDPILYVFEPTDWTPDPTVAVAAWQGGAHLRVDLERIDQQRAWDVYRVEIHDTREGELIVRYDGEVATYQLAAHARDHAALFAAEVVDDVWTCSRTTGIALATRGNAVAYRLDWPDASRGGRIASAYLPATPDEVGGVHAFVGMLSCTGTDVPDDAFLEPTPVELVALFADGREAAVPLGLIRIDEEHRVIRAPEDFAFGAAMDPPPAPPRAATRWTAVALATTELEPLWPALLIASGTGATAGIALIWVALRPRRRRTPLRVGNLAD